MNIKASSPPPFKLSIEDAKLLASKFRATENSPDIEQDPLPNIAPSLLSADHIVAYVKETGLIAPFNDDSNKGGRLKRASYEGRLGKLAYHFEVPNQKAKKGGIDPKPLAKNKAGNLVLPANSIVFVECDLDFRLPSFIALRFNLSISHVHRGLLLGTGPLIDPGFWGKLCIPIHNLTDEPYEIEQDDGLIWIEFTKITSAPKFGRLPTGDGKWDIKKFIIRAQDQVDEKNDRVGIRSGISKALDDFNDTKIAIKASEKKVANTTKWGLIGGGIAVMSVMIGVFELSFNYYSDMNAQFEKVRPDIKTLEKDFDEHIELINLAGQADSEALSTLEEKITGLDQAVTDLTNQLESERTYRQEIETRLLASEKERDELLNVLKQMKTAICSDQTDGEISEFCSNLTAESVD